MSKHVSSHRSFLPILLLSAASAALVASIFHYGQHTVGEAKAFLAARGVLVRPVAPEPDVA